MEVRFDSLLSQSIEDSSLLMELVAIYLEEIASSHTSEINKKHEQIIEVLKIHKQNSPLAAILEELCNGATLFYLTQFEKAKNILITAHKNFINGMPQDILGSINWALGANYRSIGEIDKATDFLIQAVQSIKKNGLFNITYAYSNYQLGEIHLAIGEYDSAQAYYQEALSVVSNSTNKTANFRINDGLGLCALHLNDYETSKNYFNTALAIEGLSAAERARGLCDLGVVNLNQGKHKEALRFLQDSYDLRIDNKLEDAASTSLIHLSEVQIQLAHPDKAISLLKKAHNITIKYKAQSKKIKVLKLLAIAYQEKNNTKEALNYFSQYDKLNTEIRNEQEHKIFRLKKWSSFVSFLSLTRGNIDHESFHHKGCFLSI